jgi:hypothetical protein
LKRVTAATGHELVINFRLSKKRYPPIPVASVVALNSGAAHVLVFNT